MRWMWIDRVVEFVPRERMVAIKSVSLAEEHLHDHFPADAERGLAALPVMPASLIIEGMAQTAGILVGHAGGFREKVVLAKIARAELSREVVPGETIRHEAFVERLDDAGASTRGEVSVIDPMRAGEPEAIGRIDLMFAHVDRNMSGIAFPEHNFVFGEGFRTVLQMSGIDAPGA